MEPRPTVNLQALGTHSLKTDLLTMAARATKVKFSKAERRILGHQLKPGDRSVLTYSHESYTDVCEKILACFREIQNGSFRPDSSAPEAVTAGPRVYEDPGLAEVENNEVADTWEISSV
jgi:hypothetical protein